MSTLTTTDYGIFLKCASNREIDKSNLKKIIASLNMKNLLKFRPILVNARMEVIDGQHRLEAAKHLGLPIYYQVQETTEIEDIAILNANQKDWNSEDWLHYHASQGNKEYLKLQDFMRTVDINLSFAQKLLRFKTGRDPMFYKGLWKYPEQEVVNEAVNKIKQFRITMEMLSSRLLQEPKLLYMAKFRDGLLEILSLEGLQFDRFLKNLEINVAKLHPHAGADGYKFMFLEIYNYRRHDKVSFDQHLKIQAYIPGL